MHAEWIVEQAQEYQRTHRRSPGSIEELRRELPAAAIDATDPWGQDWLLSPAFRDTHAPPNAEDLWVCSRGPTGNAPCPPEHLGVRPVSSPGSIGHSARFGGWDSEVPTDSRDLVLPILPVPAAAYVAYRIVGRLRGRPAPRLDAALAYLVVVVGVLVAIAVTFYSPTAARAYLAVAESHLRSLVSAIDAYKEHTGSLPATLADLTAPVTNQQGKAAGPFINRIPEPSP